MGRYQMPLTGPAKVALAHAELRLAVEEALHHARTSHADPAAGLAQVRFVLERATGRLAAAAETMPYPMGA